MAATAAQNLVNKKEAQLDKVTEEAQKAATRMKEEMNSLTARTFSRGQFRFERLACLFERRREGRFREDAHR